MSDEIPETLAERYGDDLEPEPTFATATTPDDIEPEPTFATATTPDDIEPEPTFALTGQDWSDFDPDVVAQVRAAEAAQQRSLIRVPEGEWPEDLDRALERRVEVNLAQYDGGEIRRVGGTDREVRRLEAPWSKVAPRQD